MKLHWGLRAVWLGAPKTVIFGWGIKRRGHYCFYPASYLHPAENAWIIDPGWSVTLWVGLWNLNLETSDARSWVSDGRSGGNYYGI
jgi:hypothetical protein